MINFLGQRKFAALDPTTATKLSCPKQVELG